MRGDNCDKYFRPWDTETDTSEIKSPSSTSTETAMETDCSTCEGDNERSPSPIINEDVSSTGNLDRLSDFVMRTTDRSTLTSWSCSSKNSENYDQSKRSNTDSSSSESGTSHGSTSPPSAFATLPAPIPVGYWAPMTNNQVITDDIISSSYLHLCRFTQASIPQLSNHVYNANEAIRLLQEQNAAKRMKKLRPKKFCCEHCNVAFSNNGQLKGHIRIHTGERPFKCNVEKCGKSFTRNEELTRHKRIHTGDKPHVCHFCSKRFGRKDHLKKHSKTHLFRGSFGFGEPVSAFNIFAGQSGSLLPVMSPLSTPTPSTSTSTTTMPLSSSWQSSLFPPPPLMIPSTSFQPRMISVTPVLQPYFSSLPITPSTPIGSTLTPSSTAVIVPTPRSSLFSELPEMTLPSEFSSLPNPDLSSLPESPFSNPSLSPPSSVETTIDHQLDYLNRYSN